MVLQGPTFTIPHKYTCAVYQEQLVDSMRINQPTQDNTMETETTSQITDATRYRLFLANRKHSKTEPTENAVEKAEDLFDGHLRVSEYAARKAWFAGDLQIAAKPCRPVEFVDHAIRCAMDKDYTAYDADGYRIDRENTTDIVDVLRALKVMAASHRAMRASNLYVGVSLCHNDPSTDRSIAQDRANCHLLRRAVAILETRLAARAKELARECSRIRRALKA